MKKILFVEDNKLIARIYSQKLADAGFQVAVAEDGLDAMRQLPEFKPDLVVLDLMMPKFTGADVLKFMRQSPAFKSTRVIVFSNTFLSNLVEQVAALKPERALVKATVNPAQLLAEINSVLEGPAPDAIPAPKTAAPAAPPETAKTPPPVPTKPAPASAANMAAAPAIKAIKPDKSRDTSFTRKSPAKADKAKEAAPTPAPAPVPEPEKEKRKQSGQTETFSLIGRDFLEKVPEVVKNINQLGQQFLAADELPAQSDLLATMNRKVSFLTQVASMAGYPRTAELSSAFEGFLFELVTKPDSINDSSRQTVVATVAFLADHFEQLGGKPQNGLAPPSILVVDDDKVSSLALVRALGRASLSAASVDDPFQALNKLRAEPFDAVLLDINMPGMDGLALCEQMRALPRHKRTPVIFVTSQSDFKTRARSVLSGGNDLIAKPISPVEVCVKVIMLMLKNS